MTSGMQVLESADATRDFRKDGAAAPGVDPDTVTARRNCRVTLLSPEQALAADHRPRAEFSSLVWDA